MSRTSVVVAVALGALLARPAAAQEPERLEVLQGTHRRLPLAQDLVRIAVGDPAIVETVEVDTRQLLILGKKPGRTTLIVWFQDGSNEQRTVVVQRDLSLLRETLAEVHSGIRVEVAPDREAVVLRGTVTDPYVGRRALEAAARYLGVAPDRVAASGQAIQTLIQRPGEQPELHTSVAGDLASTVASPDGVINLLTYERWPERLEERLTQALRLVGGDAVSVRRLQLGDLPDDARDRFILEGAVRDAATHARVLRHAGYLLLPRPGRSEAGPGEDERRRFDSLIRIDLAAPPGSREGLGADLLEERLLAALRPTGGERLSVRRLVRGALPDDRRDTFVLEGRVRSQVELVRALTLAARMLPAQGGRGDEGDAQGLEIRVLADEAGALSTGRGRQGQQQGQQQQGGIAAGGAGQGFGGAGQGFGGGGAQQLLANRVQQNVGRAKALTVGDGRLLSFVEVDDLPQVRVQLRFYEVDRTKLEQVDVDAAWLQADFPGATLAPGARALALEGAGATRVGSVSPTDVKNVLSFLGGAVGNEVQVAGTRGALSATLTLLESEGLARTLSSPTLTVLSGELATFTVGGEVPIPVAFSPALGGEGPAATGVFNGVEFRQFGVQLAVRPLVGEDDSITLDLAPQVIQPDAGLTDLLRRTTGTNQQTTAFQTRSLRTSARLQDGQALLLGGLTTRQRQSDAAFTPLLHKVPVIEWLFQDTRDARNEVELVVLVNPVIVREPRPDAGLWALPDARELLGRLRARVAAREKP